MQPEPIRPSTAMSLEDALAARQKLYKPKLACLHRPQYDPLDNLLWNEIDAKPPVRTRAFVHKWEPDFSEGEPDTKSKVCGVCGRSDDMYHAKQTAKKPAKPFVNHRARYKRMRKPTL